MKKLSVLLFVALVLGLNACDKEDDDMPMGTNNPDPIECDGSMSTYDGNIKSIINGNCNNSTCHGANSNNGDFTSFAGLSDVISNGQLKSRVLVSRNMPQGGSLTDAQLVAIQCWVDNGYPEN